jgi:hypothetical protein
LFFIQNDSKTAPFVVHVSPNQFHVFHYVVLDFVSCCLSLAVGGAPLDFVHRTALIYQPARSVTQQGVGNKWKIQFKTTNKWINPLMGWTSARDTAQQLREVLQFRTKEEAIQFAQKEGKRYKQKQAYTKYTNTKNKH